MELKERQIETLKGLTKKSATKGNLPNAAIVLEGGEMIASSQSLVASDNNVTSHAELLAIEKICKLRESAWTPGLNLVSVVEPCTMCLSAASQAGYENVYYIIPAKRYEDEVLYITDVQVGFKEGLVKNFKNDINLIYLKGLEEEFSEVFEDVLPDSLKKG
ncbi:MAG: deaminase [Candidatus Aenigmatarchaeota archaeon]